MKKFVLVPIHKFEKYQQMELNTKPITKDNTENKDTTGKKLESLQTEFGKEDQVGGAEVKIKNIDGNEYSEENKPTNKLPPPGIPHNDNFNPSEEIFEESANLTKKDKIAIKSKIEKKKPILLSMWKSLK